ncbi:beta-glucosidase [Lederbergia ruris]|uniref:beta-glucosidase n=1 Tax=Lederbergia ruris TaxID=217495 RepID=UPI00399FDE21
MVISEILKKMSLKDKMAFLTGKDRWNTVDFGQYEIPNLLFADGPHGLRMTRDNELGEELETYEAICFPTASALSATWNVELAYEMGKAMVGEFNTYNADVILGPGVNIKRSPLCGRNFEYYSEDPYLSGKLGAAFINGVQDYGMGTSLKHFAGNNQEYDRHQSSSEIGERALREIYLKAFEIAIKESNPWSVMCAYNRLNGVYCSENKQLLDDILREEWGYNGTIISDWSAVHDRSRALLASLDLEMPYTNNSLSNLQKAYEEGKITEEDINRSVQRLLELIEKNEREKEKRCLAPKTIQERLQIAKSIADEAITLLKNEECILPINKNKFKKIAVIGTAAVEPFIQGGGSAKVNPINVEIPLEEMKKESDVEILFSKGYTCHVGDLEGIEATNNLHLMDTVGIADMAVVFVGENHLVEKEVMDRTSIRLNPVMEQVILKTAEVNSNTVVVVQAGAVIDMTSWIDEVKGVIFAWYTGSCGASAISDVLFGRINPSGKIAESFPLSIEDTPTYGYYPTSPVAEYSEGLMVGYRYYDKQEKDVRFPFGHGLSYTTFDYSDFQLLSDKLEENGTIYVKCKIKNTGSRAGKEIVQLYLRDVTATVVRPVKELKGFKKLSLNAGESTTVEFTLNWSDFSFYSTVFKDWIVEKGVFEILVGSSSRDIRQSGKVVF